jgi:hypothetical protein
MLKHPPASILLSLGPFVSSSAAAAWAVCGRRCGKQFHPGLIWFRRHNALGALACSYRETRASGIFAPRDACDDGAFISAGAAGGPAFSITVISP